MSEKMSDRFKDATPQQLLRIVRNVIMQRFGDRFGNPESAAEILDMVDALALAYGQTLPLPTHFCCNFDSARLPGANHAE